MMKIYLFWSFIFLVLSTPVVACSPISWSPERLNSIPSLLKVSNNQQFLLQMNPSKWKVDKNEFVKTKDSYGTVYMTDTDGNLKKLYSIKELYPSNYPDNVGYSIFFTDDGKTIFKLNKNIINPKWSNLIIYREGKKVQSYSYSDFITKDSVSKIPSSAMSCIPRSWIKYYLGENGTYSGSSASLNYKGHLTFETVAGKLWVIDSFGKIAPIVVTKKNDSLHYQYQEDIDIKQKNNKKRPQHNSLWFEYFGKMRHAKIIYDTNRTFYLNINTRSSYFTQS